MHSDLPFSDPFSTSDLKCLDGINISLKFCHPVALEVVCKCFFPLLLKKHNAYPLIIAGRWLILWSHPASAKKAGDVCLSWIRWRSPNIVDVSQHANQRMIHMCDFSFYLKIWILIVYLHGPGFHEDVHRCYKIIIESFFPILVFFLSGDKFHLSFHSICTYLIFYKVCNSQMRENNILRVFWD